MFLQYPHDVESLMTRTVSREVSGIIGFWLDFLVLIRRRL
jgi:hypothetical protein